MIGPSIRPIPPTITMKMQTEDQSGSKPDSGVILSCAIIDATSPSVSRSSQDEYDEAQALHVHSLALGRNRIVPHRGQGKFVAGSKKPIRAPNRNQEERRTKER